MNCHHCSKDIEGNAFVEGCNIFHYKCHEAQKMALKGFIYKCPICNGDGYIKQIYNAYPSGYPDSGFVYKEGIKYSSCDFCDAIGYLTKEPKLESKWVKQ